MRQGRSANSELLRRASTDNLGSIWLVNAVVLVLGDFLNCSLFFSSTRCHDEEDFISKEKKTKTFHTSKIPIVRQHLWP